MAKERKSGVVMPVVGIGASAGGLEALTQLLQHLPADTGMAFVVVQHLDPARESALTALLSKATSLPVQEAVNNQTVQPNEIYIIPPNTSLTIANAALKLQPRKVTVGARRSIDSFFESLAQDQHERAIGVILSGAASDGTMGLEAIKGEGGITFAQDESAKYDSMPRSAIAAGCVDFVLSPENIAKELTHIARHPYVLAAALPPDENAEQTTASERPLTGRRGGGPRDKNTEDDFNTILALLRNKSGVDFSLYKTSTIKRRIHRRMVLSKLTTFDAYADFLAGRSQELDALHSDVLINVTSFFRNADSFEFLKRKVLPKLLSERCDEPLRVWVPACSTGQEVYSLAMALTEFFDNIPRAPKLQMFASDINEVLLAKARAGLYAESLVADLSPERLRRFFVEEASGGYRVIKPLREAVVFARQNILIDPPFSRMNLVSCRNMLIYFDPSLQKMILPMFHYVLKPNGCLFLGAAETIGAFTDLFEPVDKQHKIYLRKPGSTQTMHLQGALKSGGADRQMTISKLAEAPQELRIEINAQREADRVTRNRYAPPSVLVNAGFHVVEFRGDTSPYLKPPTGQASFNVLRMTREGLMLSLRGALNKAKKQNKAVRRENVRINRNDPLSAVNFEVVPLMHLKERCYLIFFEEVKTVARATPSAPSLKSAELRGDLPADDLTIRKEDLRRINELETELSETRDYLQSLQEEHEASTEELQSANEEVQSANEELQSIN
jgi:two-component system CheB/CheR fusion protein